MVAFGSADASSSADISDTDNPFRMDVDWLGTGTTTTGTLHVPQWSPATGIATTFKGHGTRSNVALSNGATIPHQDVVMTVPTASTVGGTIVVPAGYTLTNRGLSVDFPDRATVSVNNETTAATSFSWCREPGWRTTSSPPQRPRRFRT